MDLPTHAVTPSDTRPAPRGSLHPANVANRETSMRVVDLALQIADAEAQGVVEMYTLCVELDGHMWCDTETPPLDMQRHQEDRELAMTASARALRYIQLRQPGAFRTRMVRHLERPHLVRFEVTQ